MKLIQVTEAFRLGERHIQAGQSVELPDAIANQMVALNRAVFVDPGSIQTHDAQPEHRDPAIKRRK